MRRALSILVLVGFLVGGCSHATLLEAIEGSGLVEHDKPEILYSDDEEGIVIFLAKDSEGNYRLCRGSYTVSNNRYNVESSGYYAKEVNIFGKSDFIAVDSIEDGSDKQKHIVWGGIFHYPKAEEVHYFVKDENGEELHQNKTVITSKHIFIDELPAHIEEPHEVTYQVVDDEGNIIVDKS
ncbi:hypothetical protein SAMN05216389_101281 [Oceanobacillus limi]|uniref:Uncharacterized protein n=1 Tax=Oceanobacillus limi TaxID=930131 RepID=A0A1H9YAD5_9BACI|nr:hypothetical protein [Oceanobacillus limi]SES65813.1 hypothetical protein SAMN05216389_101281 [Oceanobacillus limi]